MADILQPEKFVFISIEATSGADVVPFWMGSKIESGSSE
jgi:hypothetical protein